MAISHKPYTTTTAKEEEPLRKVCMARMKYDTTMSSLKKKYFGMRKVSVRKSIRTSRKTSTSKSFKVIVDRCNYQEMFSINMWNKRINNAYPFRARISNQLTHNG